MPKTKSASELPDSATAAIIRVVNSFPCLRAKLRAAPPGYFEAGFDPVAFLGLVIDKPSQYFTAEDQERWHCAMFILNIWDPVLAFRNVWIFNFDQFMQHVTAPNRAAVADWVLSPVWIKR